MVQDAGITSDVKQRWGKITDDELMVIGGKRDKLSGVIQMKYGFTNEKAEDEIAKFEKSFDTARV